MEVRPFKKRRVNFDEPEPRGQSDLNLCISLDFEDISENIVYFQGGDDLEVDEMAALSRVRFIPAPPACGLIEMKWESVLSRKIKFNLLLIS